MEKNWEICVKQLSKKFVTSAKSGKKCQEEGKQTERSRKEAGKIGK